MSGGPDSIALLLLAAEARSGRVESATVDHGLRQESAAEARAVAELSRSLNVPHATLTIDLRVDAGGNLQARARELRYRALARWAAEQGVDAVATAHHLDDQAETVVMRLARGAGVGGLGGVRPARPLTDHILLIRPLLGWARSELRAIAETAAVKPADDPSNRDSRFDRTRARELLQRESWIDAARLAAAAANLRDAEQALEWTTSDLFSKRARVDSNIVILDVAGLPRELRRRLLARAIERLSGAAPDGPHLMRALDRLEANSITTLAGIKLEGGTIWRLSPAPRRRSAEAAERKP